MAAGRQTAAETITNLNVATEQFLLPTMSLMIQDDVVRARIMKKSKPVNGGEPITYPLIVDGINVRSVGKWDPYDLQPKEILDKAVYNWKFVEGNMVLARKDIEVINAGGAKLIDIAEAQVQAARVSMSKQFAELLYKDPDDMTANDPDSLVKICATKNNSVGGIDASVCVGGSGTVTQPFKWNPVVIDESGSGITYADMIDSSSDYYILTLLRKIVSQLTIGVDKPTLIIGPQNAWDAYETVLIAQKRYDSAVMEVDGGFLGLKFRGIPFVVDNNCPGGSIATSVSDNSGMLLVVNENYIGFKHASSYGSDNGQVGIRWTPWKKLETQAIVHGLLEWAGTIGCNARHLQGAVLGIPSDAKAYN